MSFSSQIKMTLAAQSVVVDRPPLQALSQDTEKQIEELKKWCGTENGGIAVSYFFRQYALFITAQFNLLAHHHGYFDITPEQLSFDRVHNYGYNLLQTHVSSSDFKAVSPEERFHAFHTILHRQVDALIIEFRQHVKIAPVTLWENILGSVVWFYANLEKQNPRRAAEDIEWLLDATNWVPMRKSFMASLLGDVSLNQAVSKPLRKTCCLYKKLPDFETCTFCPQPD